MSNVDNVIECAVNYATDNKHEYVTLEHLVYCLLEDSDVTDILQLVECDWETAKADLHEYLVKYHGTVDLRKLLVSNVYYNEHLPK